ncbi:protein of unknown function [Thermococcus camini]|uniref:Uncharacterized protein n=1 Tax=Thermococcus camini TaxID=2016373 RepID=A0A7G2D7G0_9EURY|nr:protein of unknown function [Thermococcus camini]
MRPHKLLAPLQVKRLSPTFAKAKVDQKVFAVKRVWKCLHAILMMCVLMGLYQISSILGVFCSNSAPEGRQK